MATCRYCANLRRCIEKATNEGYEHNVDFDASSGCPNFGFKSNTNADRIRAMSDEELATIIHATSLGYKDEWCDYHCENQGEDGCDNCIKEWLKQPAKE